MLKRILDIIRLYNFKKRWRSNNSHNFTVVENIFPVDKVIVGKRTYGKLRIRAFGNSKEKLIIGNYCSIAEGVKFILGGEHDYRNLSTFPFKRYVLGEAEDTKTKGQIIIKDDVWLGENSLILSGVTIGQGAIIGAGSVVARNIPPYSIFVRGEIIKFRFKQSTIEILENFDFSLLTDDSIRKNIDILYSVIEDDDSHTKEILSDLLISK